MADIDEFVVPRPPAAHTIQDILLGGRPSQRRPSEEKAAGAEAEVGALVKAPPMGAAKAGAEAEVDLNEAPPVTRNCLGLLNGDPKGPWANVELTRFNFRSSALKTAGEGGGSAGEHILWQVRVCPPSSDDSRGGRRLCRRAHPLAGACVPPLF